MMRRPYLATTTHAPPDGRGVPVAPDIILNEGRAAEVTGLSRRSLQRMRVEGGGPPYARLAPGRVGYPSSALRDWIAARTFASTSEESAERAKAVTP